ncbi:accessory factor UbiK family protein [Azorhizobium sp. AG788]|uniref:accessory factor UbiK family protein n=1 Tax=Azorhizobium sp. AG788 TaxID=2183897 RepID=UPI0031387661
MTQTTGRLFDEMSRLVNDAAGVAQGMRREAETVMRGQMERFLRDMDLVKREEFEVVKDLAAAARLENERLAARLAELEAKVAAGSASHVSGDTGFSGTPGAGPGPV